MSLNSKKTNPGTRRTRERELILDAVMGEHGHFSAEELALGLARRGGDVSRATIYRTLDLLVDRGTLQRVPLDEGGCRYELSRERKPHAHLYCLACGRLSDYHVKELETVLRRVGRSGFRTEHLLLRVCGYCPRCAKARPRACRQLLAGRRSGKATPNQREAMAWAR